MRLSHHHAGIPKKRINKPCSHHYFASLSARILSLSPDISRAASFCLDNAFQSLTILVVALAGNWMLKVPRHWAKL